MLSAMLCAVVASAAHAQQADVAGGGGAPTATAPSPATGADATPTAATGPDRTVDTVSLEQARTPVQALTEHFLGSASRAVRFDWRKKTVTVAASAGELIERNNYGAHRYGLLARHAFSDLIVEGGFHYVYVESTPSSNLLSLTPYRQYGRPSHLELDLNVGYAIAEGVVTPATDWMPPAQLALVAIAGGRYLLYPDGFAGRSDVAQIGLDVVSPQLSAAERAGIERGAPGGMLVDSARYHLLAGLGLEVYLQPGVFVSPRALLALPVLAPATGTGLGFWWELTVAVGYAW